MSWQIVVLILGVWWGLLFLCYTAALTQRNKDG